MDDVDSPSSEEAGNFGINEVDNSSVWLTFLSRSVWCYTLFIYFNVMRFIMLKENEASVQGKGRKRAAPRGRGRGSTQSKRGRKSVNTPVYRMLMNKDDDDDDDDDVAKRLNKPPPRVLIFLSTFFFMNNLKLVKFVIGPNLFILIFSFNL